MGKMGDSTMANTGKKAFLMRVDPQLWSELERMAAAELRSVNGQIEYLLREALNRRRGKTSMAQVVRPKVVRIRR
jgi:hypothetical protein